MQWRAIVWLAVRLIARDESADGGNFGPVSSQGHIRVTHNPWVAGSSPTRPTREIRL